MIDRNIMRVGLCVGVCALVILSVGSALAGSPIVQAQDKSRDILEGRLYKSPFSGVSPEDVVRPVIDRQTFSLFIPMNRERPQTFPLLRQMLLEINDPDRVHMRLVALDLPLDDRRRALFLESVREYVRPMGVFPFQVELVRSGNPAGKILNDISSSSPLFMVSTDVYTARIPAECLQKRKDFSMGEGGGNTTPAIGCTTAVNMAGMIANPRDLVVGRDLSPALSRRLNHGLHRYLQADGNTIITQSKGDQFSE